MLPDTRDQGYTLPDTHTQTHTSTNTPKDRRSTENHRTYRYIFFEFYHFPIAHNFIVLVFN